MMQAQPIVRTNRPAAAHGSAPADPTSIALAALEDALRSEKRLVDELIAIMRRQRGAIAADDLQGVDDSAFAIQRVLFTLGEARRRRRTLARLLTGAEDLALGDLENALGRLLGDGARVARDELRGAAMTLADEVSMNRAILREALAENDRQARVLTGAATESYGERSTVASPAPAAPSLLDRRA